MFSILLLAVANLIIFAIGIVLATLMASATAIWFLIKFCAFWLLITIVISLL